MCIRDRYISLISNAAFLDMRNSRIFLGLLSQGLLSSLFPYFIESPVADTAIDSLLQFRLQCQEFAVLFFVPADQIADILAIAPKTPLFYGQCDIIRLPVSELYRFSAHVYFQLDVIMMQY